MVTIKINNDKVNVKTFDELNVLEYIQVVTQLRDNTMDIVKYLSIVLKTHYKTAWNMEIHNPEVLMQAIGEPKEYNKLPVIKNLEIDGRYYRTDSLSILTVGQRLMIEEFGKQYKDERLLCYIIAVGIVKEPDSGKINKIFNKLLTMPYTVVLPIGFFLLKSSMNGKKSAMKHFRKSRRFHLMTISRQRQGLRNWILTQTILKSRHYAKS